MKTAISYRHITKLSLPNLAAVIKRFVNRHLERHLLHIPAELVRLRATLGRSRRRGLYRAKLRLGLRSVTLACADDSPELGKALELSFTELERQLEHHIAHLRHEHVWRRKEWRAGLRRLKPALAKEMHRFAAALLADLPTSWRRHWCSVESKPYPEMPRPEC